MKERPALGLIQADFEMLKSTFVKRSYSAFSFNVLLTFFWRSFKFPKERQKNVRKKTFSRVY